MRRVWSHALRKRAGTASEGAPSASLFNYDQDQDALPSVPALQFMATCQQTPTQTVFSASTGTIQSVSTRTSEIVTVGPPSTQTSFVTACAESATDGSCASFSTDTLVSTIPGSESTSTQLIPITVEAFVTTSVPVQTLFAPCSPIITTTTSTSSSIITTPTPTSSTTRPNNNISTTTRPTSDAPISATSTTNPASNNGGGTPTSESAVDSQSSVRLTTYISVVTVTAPNGQLTTSSSLVTSTATLSLPTSGAKNPASIGLIIGSVVGGFFGLGLLVGLFWICWRRRKVRWDDIFDKDDGYAEEPQPRRSMNLLENEPKPYEYGRIGLQSAPGPPQSPSTSHAPLHNRTPSSAPLLLPPSSTTSFDLSNSPHASPAISASQWLPGHQSTQTLSSTYNYGYPPQSPPFLPSGAGPPQKQRPVSMTASSRNPSNASNLSGTSATPLMMAGARNHGRSPSAGHVNSSQELAAHGGASPSMISPATSAGSYGAASSSVSAGPSFAVQRKARPQSYAAGSSVAPAPAPLVIPGTTYPPGNQQRQQGSQGFNNDNKAAPPAYEAAISPSASTNSAYLPLSMQSGTRLALVNPDSDPISRDPSLMKQRR